MIISHKYRFIFLKTRKTAGTSTEISLARFCGPRDVVTPVAEEHLREQFGSVPPQNLTIAAHRYDTLDWIRVCARRQWLLFHPHMQATDVRKYVGRRVWNSYFKFCCERNPWEKVISAYWHWKTELNDQRTLAQFIKSCEGWSDYDRYSINGRIAVDCVAKYEVLQEELSRICRWLGISFDGRLPSAKANARQDRRMYSEILTAGMAEEIRKKFAREIALLGYTY